MLMRIAAAAAVVVAGCGRTPVAPDGEIGWVGGVWTGELSYHDQTVAVVLWLEQDGDAIAGAGMQQTAAPIPGQPASAPATLACDTLDRDTDGVIRVRMPTGQGADVLFAISLDPATHALLGEWAADTDLADEGGGVSLSRVAWLPTREDPADPTRAIRLGCFPRPPPACADGIDNDGDGAVDGDDLGCCVPGRPCALIGNREDAEPPCANGLDDDGDGLVDALDPECGSPADLETGREPRCGDGWDNDGDGLIDLADPGCAGDPRRWSEVEPMCADGRDNDGDGAIDAADPDCATYDRESAPGAGCADGYDEDGDGLVDLADPSCHGQTLRQQEDPIGTCDDGLDNDGDGLVDLAEPTCTKEFWFDENGDWAGMATDCTDGVDNDGDGAIDDADTHCYWFGEGEEVVAAPDPMPPTRPNPCGDGIDNDGDGRIDNADPDCGLRDPLAGAPFEAVPGCQDAADGDGDGAIDLADPDCASLYRASETADCVDGIDDDGDGLIDLADPTCATDPAASEGARACADGQDNDGDGVIDAADPDCAAPYDWTEAAACADHRDNDGDGLFDAADPGCAGPDDDDEI